MIPPDTRLFTWCDVLEALEQQAEWPDWLVSARAYWDEVCLGVRPGSFDAAVAGLRVLFEPRYVAPEPAPSVAADGLKNGGHLILEALHDHSRELPVWLEAVDEAIPQPRLRASLSRPSTLWRPNGQPEPPASWAADMPPVVAFHSFKGDVGRTIHAIATARALADENRRVLLIDADLEAPGITWLVRSRLPAPPVSFADLVALVHGDPDPEAPGAVGLVAERLQDRALEGVWVLPAFRSDRQFASLEVRPEHLSRSPRDPFRLTRAVADVGRRLGAEIVLVDLRAGLSEMASGFLLDPRVQKVLVTTLASQSILGTCQVLSLLRDRTPAHASAGELPTVIITQVPREYDPGPLLLQEETRLLTAWTLHGAQSAAREPGGESEAAAPLIFRSRFASGLVVLPHDWDEAVDEIRSSGIPGVAVELAREFPLPPLPTASPAATDLRRRRELLYAGTEKLVYAEREEVQDFLVTDSLRRIVSENQHELPVAIIVGAKGAGKTFTFQQLARHGEWRSFVRQTLDGNGSRRDKRPEEYILPLFASLSLSAGVREVVTNAGVAAAKALSGAAPLDLERVQYCIVDTLKKDWHEGHWQQAWLDLMAWRAGFSVEKEGAGTEFLARLRKEQKKVLFILDGIEDLLPDVDSDRAQQVALRALLQNVPNRLEQEPERPVGLLAFVRRDHVLSAVRQNANQLLDRYKTYALRWSRREALHLVYWLASRFGGIPKRDGVGSDTNEAEFAELLAPLWGRKLGLDTAREGRSADWVMGALSDLHGQVQARDVVRLILYAAEGSRDDTQWTDRLLTPQSIRKALPECSRNKVEELQIESPTLLRPLLEVSGDLRKIPFRAAELNLSLETLQVLENAGVLYRDGDSYYMPEIYRLGLNYTLTLRGRPRVLALARRAARGD